MADTFNGPTGVTIALPRQVDAVNEYSVKVTPSSRAAAIGDVWVVKAIDGFTVYCSQSNTADSFEATVYYLGDVASYGGSMYRRYYVSPLASIADHSAAGTPGSLAYMLAAIGSTPAVLELPGNKIYTLTAADVTIPSTLVLLPQPGAVISIGAGRTLTFNGPMIAGRWRVFSGSGDLVFNAGSVGEAFFEWIGAVGDGETDCGSEMNALADACRDAVIPMSWGTGNFYTTVSLNFTGANYDAGFGGHGWQISGAGPGATLITGNLASAYPIIDLSDCNHSMLRDVRIYGHASGSQLCGILHARVAGALATSNATRDVIVTGTFQEAALINFSSDLPKYKDSYFDGPCGAIITASINACGSGIIQSAYQSLTEISDATLCNFINTTVLGHGGDSIGYDSAIVMYEWGTIDIDAACYIAQTVAANTKEGTDEGGDERRRGQVNYAFEKRVLTNSSLVFLIRFAKVSCSTPIFIPSNLFFG